MLFQYQPTLPSIYTCDTKSLVNAQQENKRKKKATKSERRGEEGKPKVNVQTAVPSAHAGFSDYFVPGTEGGEVLEL